MCRALQFLDLIDCKPGHCEESQVWVNSGSFKQDCERVDPQIQFNQVYQDSVIIVLRPELSLSLLRTFLSLRLGSSVSLLEGQSRANHRGVM
jgi:hypothetical protein